MNYLQAYIIKGTVIDSFFHRSFTDFIFIQPLKIPKDPKINNFADKTINKQPRTIKATTKTYNAPESYVKMIWDWLSGDAFYGPRLNKEWRFWRFFCSLSVHAFVDQTGFVQLHEPVYHEIICGTILLVKVKKRCNQQPMIWYWIWASWWP